MSKISRAYPSEMDLNSKWLGNWCHWVQITVFSHTRMCIGWPWVHLTCSYLLNVSFLFPIRATRTCWSSQGVNRCKWGSFERRWSHDYTGLPVAWILYISFLFTFSLFLIVIMNITEETLAAYYSDYSFSGYLAVHLIYFFIERGSARLKCLAQTYNTISPARSGLGFCRSLVSAPASLPKKKEAGAGRRGFLSRTVTGDRA